MLKRLSSYTFALLAVFVLISSCKKEYESIENIDDTKIQQYISANKITATKNDKGIYTQIVSQGTGDNYKNTDSVYYHWTIKSLTSGTLYYADSQNGNTAGIVAYTNSVTIPLQNVTIDVPAFRDAILALKPGGVAKLFVPSNRAYGKNGYDVAGVINVPGNEPLEITITTLTDKSQSTLDEKLILAFIAKNKLNMLRDPSGVYYTIITPGVGSVVINKGTTLSANYTIRLLDGTVAESVTNGSFTDATLSGLIDGWKKIIPKITAGGKVRMLIPSGLAYGNSYSPSLTANAILDYDVEILTAVNQ
ncbi:MAG: hypothetical protein EOO88_10970 [Pedobacter sp.]|nr:MAG: hypothetical protein EOO88_10970 [Pedobacter sp.]